MLNFNNFNHFWWVWPGMPKVPKIASLQSLDKEVRNEVDFLRRQTLKLPSS